MVSFLRRGAPLAAGLLLAGCTAMQPYTEPWPPAPVPAPAPSRPAPSVSAPSTQPPAPPAPLPPAIESPAPEPWFSAPAPAPARPSENTAVVALLDKSRSQSAAGQWDSASASLERALRIEPRNAALWQELARVRLGQGDYRQAENLAAKSNSLAGSDRRLRAENWRIIGEARRQRGDQAGAKAAFDRAERERGW